MNFKFYFFIVILQISLYPKVNSQNNLAGTWIEYYPHNLPNRSGSVGGELGKQFQFTGDELVIDDKKPVRYNYNLEGDKLLVFQKDVQVEVFRLESLTKDRLVLIRLLSGDKLYFFKTGIILGWNEFYFDRFEERSIFEFIIGKGGGKNKIRYILEDLDQMFCRPDNQVYLIGFKDWQYVELRIGQKSHYINITKQKGNEFYGNLPFEKDSEVLIRKLKIPDDEKTISDIEKSQLIGDYKRAPRNLERENVYRSIDLVSRMNLKDNGDFILETNNERIKRREGKWSLMNWRDHSILKLTYIDGHEGNFFMEIVKVSEKILIVRTPFCEENAGKEIQFEFKKM